MKKTTEKKSNKAKLALMSLSAGLLGVSPIIPYVPSYQVEAAKVTADVWPYSNEDVLGLIPVLGNEDVPIYSTKSYSGQVSKYVVVPERLYKNATQSANLEYLGVDLQNKGIEAVSFLQAKNISEIGAYYESGSTKPVPTFRNNKIKEIHWNADSFYRTTIIIHPKTFEYNELTYLDLPSAVISIYDYAFAHNKIEKIYDTSSLSSIMYYAFAYNQLISKDDSGYVFKLPTNSSYRYIYDGSFLSNKLTEITIPENVLQIWQFAFAYNPLKSVYFQSPTVLINENAFGQVPQEGMIVYGNGANTTAKTYADSYGLQYVDMSEYETLVRNAETTGSEEDYNTALNAVMGLEESSAKTSFTERLEDIKDALEAIALVQQAETTLLMTDYKAAKKLVDKKVDSTEKTNLLNRLSAILPQIELNTYNEIERKYREGLGNNTLTLGLLSEQLSVLKGLSNQSAQVVALTATIQNSYDEIAFETYKKVVAYTKVAVSSPTVQNATNAKKWLDLLPVNYAYSGATYTDTNEYLLDENGDKVIDIENSYDVDEQGSKTLKTGLTEPIYIVNPLYNIEQIAGNGLVFDKATMENELEALEGQIYAQSAIEIARKYITNEKLSDAVALVNNLPASTLKTKLLEELQVIQGDVTSFETLQAEIESKLQVAVNSLKESDVKAVEEIIETLPNDYWKTYYSEELKTIYTKQEVETIVAQFEAKEGSQSALERLIVLASLLPQDDTSTVELLENIGKYRDNMDFYTYKANNATNNGGTGTTSPSTSGGIKDSISNTDVAEKTPGASNGTVSVEETRANYETLKDVADSVTALQTTLDVINKNQNEVKANTEQPFNVQNLLAQLSKTKNELESSTINALEQTAQKETEIIESLSSSNGKINDLNNIIVNLNVQIDQLKEDLEKRDIENNQYTEENYVALKAELVSQKEAVKKAERGTGISIIILILMGAYAIVSLRNNRKKIEENGKEDKARVQYLEEKIIEMQTSLQSIEGAVVVSKDTKESNENEKTQDDIK